MSGESQDLTSSTSSKSRSGLKLLLGGVALAVPLAFGGALYAQDAEPAATGVDGPPMSVGEAEAPATEGADAAVAETDGSGWISSEQDERGEALYDQTCASCHAEDIVESFVNYPNAGLFYGFISTTMPANAPGSLMPQQYADIIAYLLAENEWPIGDEELPPEQGVLSEIVPAEPGSGGNAEAGAEADADADAEREEGPVFQKFDF